jgi:replicative DNA helicase
VNNIETTPNATVDRAPVYDLGAEQLILGVLLTSPGAVSELAGQLDADDFYSPKHQEIFAAVLTLHSDKSPTDATAVSGYLADQGSLARLGGAPFLLECCELAPPLVQLGYYASRVGDLADARAVEANALQVAREATKPGRDLAEVADLAQRLTAKVAKRRGVSSMVPLGSLINPGLDLIEERLKQKPGLDTGFRQLDELLGGIRRKQLVTVAGATSMGKSITLIDFARQMCIKDGQIGAFFSLEMGNDEVFERILSAQSEVLHKHIRTGKMDDSDWSKATKQIGPMTNAPLLLSDRGKLTVAQIVQSCQEVIRSHGRLDVVFVDHMHLVKPSSPRIVERTAIIENVAEDLKSNLAMDLDVPVIAAAQLKRNDGVKADQPPQLTDLKGSSSIEQMSNVAIIVHRPEYYDAESPRAGETDFVVAKNRDGEKGTVTVASQLHLSRFVDFSLNRTEIAG